MRLWYRIWKNFLHVLICIFFNVRFIGKENVPKQGPLLLVSNHQSYLDPPLCGIALDRECDFMARKTLFDNPIFGALIHSVNAFPIQQSQADISTIKTLINRLKNNRAVIIFPEGSRSLDGRIHPLKNGFELIARRSQATIIPVAIDGAYEAWPRGKKCIKLGTSIRVIYGKPISNEQIQKTNRKEFVSHIQNLLQKMHNDLRRRFGKNQYHYHKTDTGKIEEL